MTGPNAEPTAVFLMSDHGRHVEDSSPSEDLEARWPMLFVRPAGGASAPNHPLWRNGHALVGAYDARQTVANILTGTTVVPRNNSVGHSY